jgi:TRAP-type C4-dicarboxylate transport system permease small subunit
MSTSIAKDPGPLIGIIEAVSRAGVAISAAMVALIFLLMLAEIIARGLFQTSTLVSWELSGYLMAAVIFVASAGAARSGSHIRVGFPMSPVLGRVLEIFWTLCAIAVCAFLSWTMIDLAYQAIDRGIVSTTPLQTPLAYSHVPNAVGSVMLTLQLLARLARLAIGLPPEVADAGDPESVDR